MKIKKIGLVGGLGPASTQKYYKEITDEIMKDAGVLPHLLINSVPMQELNSYIEHKMFDEAAFYLVQQINILQFAGAEITAIASNTPHIVFDQVKPLVSSELISIIDTTIEAVKKKSS